MHGKISQICTVSADCHILNSRCLLVETKELRLCLSAHNGVTRGEGRGYMCLSHGTKPWLHDFNYIVCLAEQRHINLICSAACNNPKLQQDPLSWHMTHRSTADRTADRMPSVLLLQSENFVTAKRPAQHIVRGDLSVSPSVRPSVCNHQSIKDHLDFFCSWNFTIMPISLGKLWLLIRGGVSSADDLLFVMSLILDV